MVLSSVMAAEGSVRLMRESVTGVVLHLSEQSFMSVFCVMHSYRHLLHIVTDHLLICKTFVLYSH